MTVADQDYIDALRAFGTLLDIEAKEQRRRTEEERDGKTDVELQELGVLLKKARIVDEVPALLGRVTIWVGVSTDEERAQLQRFRVRPGAVVVVRETDHDTGKVVDGVRGVVAQRRATKLKIVFDEAPRIDDGRITLLTLDDSVTLQRLQKAVGDATSWEGHQRRLCSMILGLTRPQATAGTPLTLLDTELHDDQATAAWHGVLAPEIGLIHGPPGTGKTRVVVEVIRQCVAKGERVLALCSSNNATDNLALGLVRADPKIALARVGHIARVDERLEARTLSALTANHERRKLAKSLVAEAFRFLAAARKRSSRGKDSWKEEREARAEAGKLFADARQLERQAAEEVLRTTNVICGTLTGFASEVPEASAFTTLVVDEASQALTPALLLALPRVQRVVLAGDHRQLPPTVLSREAEDKGLNKTAFDILGADDQQSDSDESREFAHMLRVQHRMHSDIMSFPSTSFYGGALVAHESVAARNLASFRFKDGKIVHAERAIEWLDTAGAGFDDALLEKSSSRIKTSEASVIVEIVKDLVAIGVEPRDIGIVTPYSGQVGELNKRLTEHLDAGLQVDSVDGFQGREKRVIVFSTVRSNPDGEIGFLSDVRRLNVAITRAQCSLIIVGDSATMGRDRTWGAMIDDLIARGAYRSVFELGFDFV